MDGFECLNIRREHDLDGGPEGQVSRLTEVEDDDIVPWFRTCFLVGLVGGVPGGSLMPGASLPVTVSRSGEVKGLRASQL